MQRTHNLPRYVTVLKLFLLLTHRIQNVIAEPLGCDIAAAKIRRSRLYFCALY